MPANNTPTRDWITLSVAFYGALLSTLVFLWDILKWRTSRGKLQVRCSISRPFLHNGVPGYVEVDDAAEPGALLVYKVTNVGGQPVTVVHLGGSHWRWRRWKPARREFLTLGEKVPTALEPSDYFTATRDNLSALGWVTSVFAIDSLDRRSEAPREDVRKVRKAIARGRRRT